jgi:hypothetical protein
LPPGLGERWRGRCESGEHAARCRGGRRPRAG